MPAIKVRKRNATPLRVSGQLSELYLNVHYHVAGLLDLSDPAQVYLRAKAADQRALHAQVAKVSAGADARKDEENERRAGQGQQSQNGRNACQRTVKLDVVLGKDAGSHGFLF